MNPNLPKCTPNTGYINKVDNMTYHCCQDHAKEYADAENKHKNKKLSKSQQPEA